MATATEMRAEVYHRQHAEARRRRLNGGRLVTFSYQNAAGVWLMPFPCDDAAEARNMARRYRSRGYATKVSIL